MWNNRIVKHEKDDTVYYSVHEVFYKEDGGIYGYTENPITILGETVEDVKSQLEMIMKDIEKHEVIDASTVKFEDWHDDYRRGHYKNYEVADCDHNQEWENEGGSNLDELPPEK